MARQDLFDQRRSGAWQADDEDRIRRSAAGTGALTEKLPAVGALAALHPRRIIVGTIRNHLAAQRVAAQVMLERLRVFVGILQRLADREFEMQAILRAEVAALQLLAHRLQLIGVEAEGLQVGQAPVRLAETGFQRDAPAVSLDRAVLESCGLQRMAVAHPDPGVARIFGEDSVIDLDRWRVVADPAQDHRFEIAVTGIVRFDRQQGFDLCQRLHVLVTAIEHQRVVLPRGVKARGEFEATRKQQFGIVVATQPGRDFGQHAQGGDIGRRSFQMRAQQRFGLWNTVLYQRRCGRQ